MTLKVGKLYTGKMNRRGAHLPLFATEEMLREVYRFRVKSPRSFTDHLEPTDTFLVLGHLLIPHPGSPKTKINIYKVLLGRMETPVWILLPNEGAWQPRC